MRHSTICCSKLHFSTDSNHLLQQLSPLHCGPDSTICCSELHFNTDSNLLQQLSRAKHLPLLSGAALLQCVDLHLQRLEMLIDFVILNWKRLADPKVRVRVHVLFVVGSPQPCRVTG